MVSSDLLYLMKLDYSICWINLYLVMYWFNWLLSILVQDQYKQSFVQKIKEVSIDAIR